MSLVISWTLQTPDPGPRPSAGVSSLVAPVALAGFHEMGGWAGVQASGNELSSEGDDAVAHRHRSPLRARVRSSGAWLDGFEAALSISPEETV